MKLLVMQLSLSLFGPNILLNTLKKKGGVP
jgi:hypothetical protein